MPGKKRVGVLGGSFDPIHIGHLVIAEEAREQLQLERVVFVPAREQWRKPQPNRASPEDRLAMVRLGIARNPAFVVSTVDLDREGPSYSVDTLRDLGEHQEDSEEFYFILGQDALMDLPSWYAPDRLARLAQLVAVVRPSYEIVWDQLRAAIPDVQERVLLLTTPGIDISSTEIRARVASGGSIRYWLPDAVAEYIATHRLYRHASSGGLEAPGRH